MAPRRLLLLLLLLVAVAAASSLPAEPSTTAAHEPAGPPSRELPAADPAAAAFPGACAGLVIPPHMIRAAVPAGPYGVYHVTVVLRATRHGGQYHVVPGDDGDGGHREESVPMLITTLVVWCVTFILYICLERIIGLRGDAYEGDEAYSGGDGAVPMKSVLVENAHADAVTKVKQPRGDN